MRFNEQNFNRLHMIDMYDWGEEWMKDNNRNAVVIESDEIESISLDPYESLYEDFRD